MSSATEPSNETNRVASSTATKKRRRRTVTTGASEDCFACRKNQIQCDRVRPFCGQCLGLGKECSGYRTTLTWGVGVASRGKLRGMSLPVLVTADPSTKPSQAGDSSSTLSNSSTTTFPQSLTSVAEVEEERPNKRRRATAPGSQVDEQNQSSNSSSTPLPNASWLHPTANQSAPPFPQDLPQSTHEEASQFIRGVTTLSSSSLPPGLISHGFLESHWEQQRTVYAPSLQGLPNFVDPFDPQRSVPPFQRTANAGLFLPSQRLASSQRASTSNPEGLKAFSNGHSVELPSPSDSHSTLYSPLDDDTLYSFALPHSLPQGDFDLDDHRTYNDGEDTVQGPLRATGISIPQSLDNMTFFHLPHRMQYLLDFYNRAICSVLVAFDEPSNPYRHHILRLAMHSVGLQHALAALVTNNMRMRNCQHVPWAKQEPERRRKLTAPGNPTAEEQFHKLKSIQLLNEELKDARKASDDAVLATLLVLCLFHVCNSGFSKFKTQLAGVQKLLRMRTREIRSDFIGWVEMFFAWFDVMNSAVNDREIEIRGDSLDMKDFTANLGALEHYSGCDGRLFKIIARLGRLNLLSQGRPVRDEPGHEPNDPGGSDIELETKMIQQLEAGIRGAFWQEWYAVRERLNCWKFSEDKDNPDEDVDKISIPQRHIMNISEAFRYSALLYTERLAYPQLPSKHKNFQGLVKQTMSYIGAIGVNSIVTKFLLWPLFVTGTECVEESHRNMIRERCVEIQQESGFYNNISGLQVLERMWHENDIFGQELRPPEGQALWWRKAMDRVDGEYIVI